MMRSMGFPIKFCAAVMCYPFHSRWSLMSFEWNKSETERGPERSYRINTKGVNYRSKYVPQTQQQRPESPSVNLTWHTCYTRCINFTRSSGVSVPCNLHACQVSYRMRLSSLLLCLCDVFRALINSLVRRVLNGFQNEVCPPEVFFGAIHLPKHLGRQCISQSCSPLLCYQRRSV